MSEFLRKISPRWCVMRYGAFEFLATLFGLIDTLATFCTLVNNVFHDYLDKFGVLYMDDIMAYSKNLAAHEKYLVWVLEQVKDVEAIKVWPVPKNVSELRLFFDLANYYWQFLEGYPDVMKLFKVHINASNIALGGILVRHGHLVAYESCKLNAGKWSYKAQEKELLVQSCTTSEYVSPTC
ncbi:uncharacterized protein LOC104456318 [Eucalyptus grandis]|uniref:uncharacterized protein LOC104456318 n=1 Tax=Eucalyptus grandis TaxID=71139 RepID=UPI00192EE5A6|nr:uncharacterized protein LOC104456318 [Eucalyptus grandis]